MSTLCTHFYHILDLSNEVDYLHKARTVGYQLRLTIISLYGW